MNTNQSTSEDRNLKHKAANVLLLAMAIIIFLMIELIFPTLLMSVLIYFGFKVFLIFGHGYVNLDQFMFLVNELYSYTFLPVTKWPFLNVWLGTILVMIGMMLFICIVRFFEWLTVRFYSKFKKYFIKNK